MIPPYKARSLSYIDASRQPKLQSRQLPLRIRGGAPASRHQWSVNEPADGPKFALRCGLLVSRSSEETSEYLSAIASSAASVTRKYNHSGPLVPCGKLVGRSVHEFISSFLSPHFPHRICEFSCR